MGEVTKSEHDEMKQHLHGFIKKHTSRYDGEPSITGMLIEEFDEQFGYHRWDGNDDLGDRLGTAYTNLIESLEAYVDAFVDTHVGVREPKCFKVQGHLDGPFLGTFAVFVTAYDEIEAEDMVKEQFGKLVIIAAVKEYHP